MLTDFIDYNILGSKKKKKLRLTSTSFIAGYLQLLIRSNDYKEASQAIKERIRHLSFLVHLFCRYDDFDAVFHEYKIVQVSKFIFWFHFIFSPCQADIEDNVTDWTDYEYFRRWENKIVTKINSDDADHTYNEAPDFNDDTEHSLVKSEFKDDGDPEYKPNKPTLINISKKMKKKGIKKGPGKCPRCLKHVKKLHTHMITVHGEKTFPCPQCDYVGKIPQALKNHIRRIHCAGEEGEEKKVAKKRKVRAQTNKVFKCSNCDFTCGQDKKIKEHEYEAHGTAPECQECNVVCDTIEDYLKHVKSHTVTCDVCGKALLKEGIDRHMETMHGAESEKMEVCSICGLSIKALSLPGHIKKVHTFKMYPCPSCSYQAKTDYDLRRHVKRKHEESNVVNCPWCGRLSKDLERHLKANQCNIPEHERTIDEPKFACEHCNKMFKKEAALLRHFRIVHEKIKDFQCDQCQYKTSTAFNLRIHVKRVHERKPLKEMCPHCDKAFIQLDWHIETYHGELVTHIVS